MSRMDEKTSKTVERILNTCIDGIYVNKFDYQGEVEIDWEDWEDTFNQVYAEIKKLLTTYVNAQEAQDDVDREHYREGGK